MEMSVNDKSWVDVSSSLLGEEYLKNPYPVYEKLRSLGRVVRIEEGDSQIWIFSHYDDVADIQKDKRFLSRRTPEYRASIIMNSSLWRTSSTCWSFLTMARSIRVCAKL